MNSNWSYSLETFNLGQNRRFCSPRDLEIWRMTLKYNRTLILCHFKLCVLFHSHLSIETGVTTQKRPYRGKICFDLCDLDLEIWPWLLHGHRFVNGRKFHGDTMRGTLWKRNMVEFVLSCNEARRAACLFLLSCLLSSYWADQVRR